MTALHVHAWRNELAVPRDWEAGRRQAAASELEGMTQEVATLLAQALDGVLDPDAVVLLPALHLEGRFDLRADRHAACAHWAGELARLLLRALGDPASGAVLFPTRAHHAAAYLVARTRGSAGGTWWWRSFDGFGALPLAQAVRTLLADTPAAGLAILRALDGDEAIAVVCALGEREGWTVLRAWCEQAHAGAAPLASAPSPGLAAALRHAAGRIDAPAAAALLALRELALAASDPAAAATEVVHAAAGALMLAARGRDRAAGQDPLHGVTADARAVLRHLGGASRQALARALREEHAAADNAPDGPPDAVLHSAFGGAAWLLHALHDLLARSARWPWPAGLPAPGVGLLSLLTIAAAMPAARAHAAWRDAAWRKVLDVPQALDLDAACEALARATEAAAAASDGWEDWLARTARSACPLRLRGADGGPAWPVDAASGLWLTPAVAALLPAADRPGFRTRLAWTRSARAELRFLAGNPVTRRLPQCWQRLVLHFAHAALRRLAVRIPGMAWASAAHLHGNVLGVAATLRPGAADGDWLLQVERPPLDVLLAMTGLVRARWPVLPGRWIVLARADGGAA